MLTALTTSVDCSPRAVTAVAGCRNSARLKSTVRALCADPRSPWSGKQSGSDKALLKESTAQYLSTFGSVVMSILNSFLSNICVKSAGISSPSCRQLFHLKGETSQDVWQFKRNSGTCTTRQYLYLCIRCRWWIFTLIHFGPVLSVNSSQALSSHWELSLNVYFNLNSQKF